jgi:hypothetical protein
MKPIEEINREFETIGVKGITPMRVEQLIKMMEGERSRLEKRLVKSLGLVEKYQSEAKTIGPGLQALQDDLERAFGTKGFNISLLHKKSGGSTYIKGRCWWNGRQREVQIGSIRTVLTRINQMIAYGAIDYLQPVDDLDLTWEQLRGQKQLVRAIREIGKIKFRKYLIRKLLSEYPSPENESERLNEIPVELEFEHLADADVNIPDEATGNDWYEQWSKENL